jgi:hypothetical protein
MAPRQPYDPHRPRGSLCENQQPGTNIDISAAPRSASRSFPMICSAVNFFPRGISCPPLVRTTGDSLSGSGAV